MPAILTLHSGAALAVSSNLISASHYTETDEVGRTLCVDLMSVSVADEGAGIYDLGDDPPSAVVNVIKGEQEGYLYYERKEDKDAGITYPPGLMCETGNQVWYKPPNGPWETRQVAQGFVASSGAIASFAGYVHSTLI